MPLHAGAGGADKSYGVHVGSSFKWMKSNWIEALILSPKQKERVSGTLLAMAVGTVFAFSEVNCIPFPLCHHRLCLPWEVRVAFHPRGLTW